MHHCASSLYTRELKVIVLYQPFQKTALSLAPHHHPCLPCQREVDWRQGTSCCFVAFACDMSVFFIHQTFLPSRRRDCHTAHRLYIFSVSYISKYNCVIKNRRESTSLHVCPFLYNTSITHQSVHRFISQLPEQLYNKPGAQC